MAHTQPFKSWTFNLLGSLRRHHLYVETSTQQHLNIVQTVAEISYDLSSILLKANALADVHPEIKKPSQGAGQPPPSRTFGEMAFIDKKMKPCHIALKLKRHTCVSSQMHISCSLCRIYACAIPKHCCRLPNPFIIPFWSSIHRGGFCYRPSPPNPYTKYKPGLPNPLGK